MTAVQKQIGSFFLLVSLVAGQSSNSGNATIQDVKVARDGNRVRVEVTLSLPVRASVTSASHPDRLVLELPNTVAGARQRHIPVNYGGVRSVRVGLNTADPPVTHLVVDLDQAQPYALQSSGATLVLSVGPPVRSVRRNAPAPAASSGGLIGIFRRQHNSPPAVAVADPIPVPPPPPSQPPIEFPQDQTTNGTRSGAGTASAHPTAAHPNVGSLQQGTAFPSLGSPGAGNVPPVADATRPGFQTATAASGPANTGSVQPNSGFSGTPSAASAPIPAVVTPPAKAEAPSQPQPTAVVSTTPSELSGFNAKSSTAPSTTSGSIPASTEAAMAPPVKTSAPAVQQPTAGASANPSGGHGLPAAAPVEPASISPSAAVPEDNANSTASLTTTAPVSRGSLPLQGSAGQAAVSSDSASAPASVETADAMAGAPEAVSSATTGAEQPVLLLRAADPSLRTVFKVKYVADGVAYLDGGRSSGLAEGMKLEVLDSDLPVQQGTSVDPSDPKVAAELEVSGLAETSAVTDIHNPKRPVKAGDLAYLSSGDAAALLQQRTLSTTRKYPAVVTFTEGDPLEEEARAEVPKPPLPSVNRARGRIGLDYLGTISHGASTFSTSNLGLVLRADITRINGTFWNLSGYWRGRLTSTSGGGQQTLQDLINRTYHLSMSYENPGSAWVAAFGRLYLPWAPSLDTIDGGYFGRRLGHGTTTGIFAGSTPDPTSWSYNPNQEIGGAFINFEGGSFDAFHYSSTSGAALSFLNSQVNRPFVFFENSLSYKRILTIYDSLQADSPRGNPQVTAPGPGLSRNFFTMRVQVTPRVELDFNHNYFRDIPTFDPALIGTGLLDKYLFQGFSAGARVEVVKNIFVYGDFGRSSRSGDTSSSWNQLYGLTFNRLPWLGVRADAHYSKFSSSFGDGSYKSLSLSRHLNDTLRLELLAGQEQFNSPLSTSTGYRFLNANVETTFGPHYFLQGGFTVNRGSLSYDQWSVTMGWRFDSKEKRK